jgi:hypothetical protein
LAIAQVPLERLKVLMRRRVGSFAEVQEQTRTTIEPGEELASVFGFDIQDMSSGFWQAGVAGRFDIANQAAVVPDDAFIAGERDALAGSDSAQQAAAFDIANDGLNVTGRLSEDVHRTSDQLVVFLNGGPLITVVERSRHAPQGERVVAEMVVQLD